MDKNRSVNSPQLWYPLWPSLWQWLTQPSGLIQDVILRRKAALLSGLLLLILALEMASIVFRAVFFPDVQMTLRHVVIVLLLASIYLLSRTRYYQITAGLTVFFYPITVFTVVLSGASPIPELPLMGLMIALFVGNLLLTVPGLVALGVFNVAGTLIVVWLVPENFPHINLVPAIVLFNTIAAMLVIVSRCLHQRIEQDRLASLQEEITERQQAEIALRQSEERFAKVFAASPDALFLSRMRDGYVVDVSQNVEQLFGYSRSELIGNSTAGLNLYAHLEDRSKMVHQLQQHGSLRDHELLARKKSGELLILTVSIELIELEGEPHMISAIRDITEQKQVEAQLAYHAYIMENLAEGLNYVDDQGIIRFTNPAFDAMFGFERGEVIGQNISVINDLPPAENQKFVADVLTELQTKGYWAGEFSNRKKDGTPMVTQAKVQALTLGEQSYWVTFQQDITERKQAEAALRASEARYRALYNHSPVMMHSIDLEGRLVSVSDYWLEVMGYERDEVIGRPSISFLTAESRRYAHRIMIPEFMKTGHVKDIPYQFVKKNGDVIDILLSAVAEYDKDGNFERSMAVLVDVTERNQLEAQLRQAQKMEAVGQLTAGIAHDFNNLLTAINGFAELTQLALAPNDPVATNIAKILHSGQLAASLINQLMIFSHKQIIEPQVFNLNEVVNQTDKLLRRIIGEHIDLKTTISPILWPVKVDRTQIEQVIVNLAVNARDAMPEGGQLIIETANIALDTNLDRAGYLQMTPGEYVLLTVSDTGVGMSQAIQSRIFEPFFTTKERGRGTGLGLATVYGIVKQNSGGIQVDSEVGQGTTFNIYLPRTEDPDPRQASEIDVAELPTGSETILLVEDDDGVRGLVSRILEMQGYTVLAADNGQEALQLAAQHHGAIDLLLTDVVMPGIHGRALAEQLSQRHPNLKVLYISGYSDEEIAHHGVLNSGVAFLQKPFKFSVLAHKIRQVLDLPTLD